MTISFYLHQSKTPGYSTIYHRVRHDGIGADLNSTGIKVKNDDWDRSEKRVKRTDPEAFFKNERLTIITNKLNAIYNAAYRDGKPISADLIKAEYEYNPHLTYLELYGLFQAYQERRAQQTVDQQPESPVIHDGRKKKKKQPRKARKLTESTLRQFATHRGRIVDFLISIKNVHILASAFDDFVYRQLIDYLDTEGYEDGYVWKVGTTARAVLEYGVEWKHLRSNPLIQENFVSMPEPAEPMPLSPAEYENLRDVPFENQAMQRVADVFVVYCRTGFHYMDLKLMAKNAEEAIRTGPNGKPWIYHDRLKTGVTAKVPLLPDVIRIVDKYGGWDRLPIISDTMLNKWLKLIAADRKLMPELSIKIGRKTFTDWLLNVQKWSQESIQVVLALKSTKSLNAYGKPNEKRVALEIEDDERKQVRREVFRRRAQRSNRSRSFARITE